MPHQCTACGRTFEDGSKEMLSGCPDCGGNKFQFRPAGAAEGNASTRTASGGTEPKKTPDSVSSTRTDRPSRDTDASRAAETDRGSAGDDRAGAVNRAAATVRNWVRTRNDPDDSPSARNASPAEAGSASTRNDPPAGAGSESTDAPAPAPSAESSAQADARRDVVDESELPDDPQTVSADPPADTDANVVNAPDNDNPGLKELREELNSQFESIRIVEPGQYELNLMELYEREEYIISLQEDGKYVIEVPDAWDAQDR